MARKSKRAIQQEREAVLDVLRESKGGLTHARIRALYAERFARPISYMTLRARLLELETSAAINRMGRRNPSYQLRQPGPHPDDGKRRQESGELREDSLPGQSPGGESGEAKPSASEIPLSVEAQRTRSLIHLPRANRTHVTYDSEFLDAYVPGITWYLPPPLRDRLGGLGRTAFLNQPAGTYARDIMQRLIIDLSWGSSHLEGNKYSRIDTEALIRAGREASGASDRDRQMILNHKAAIEFLVECAQDIEFNRYTVLNLHGLLAENLLDVPEDEGRLRARAVTIGTSVYTPSEIPQVIEEKFDTILAKATAIMDPYEQSFFVMVHLPYLQPFIDVNKRTSRLAANISLIKANLCPLSFVDVPEPLYSDGILAVYERTEIALLRDVFAWAYERSCAQFKVLREAMGEPDPIRLNYRTELRAIVADVVREQAWPDDADLHARAVAHAIPEGVRRDFVLAARGDLKRLRVEILARFQLRKSEFDAWVQAVGHRRVN